MYIFQKYMIDNYKNIIINEDLKISDIPLFCLKKSNIYPNYIQDRSKIFINFKKNNDGKIFIPLFDKEYIDDNRFYLIWNPKLENDVAKNINKKIIDEYNKCIKKAYLCKDGFDYYLSNDDNKIIFTISEKEMNIKILKCLNEKKFINNLNDINERNYEYLEIMKK